MDVLKFGKLIFDFVQVSMMNECMCVCVQAGRFRVFYHWLIDLANALHYLPQFNNQMDVIRSGMKLNFAKIRYVVDRNYKQSSKCAIAARYTDAAYLCLSTQIEIKIIPYK